MLPESVIFSVNDPFYTFDLKRNIKKVQFFKMYYTSIKFDIVKVLYGKTRLKCILVALFVELGSNFGINVFYFQA